MLSSDTTLSTFSNLTWSAVIGGDTKGISEATEPISEAGQRSAAGNPAVGWRLTLEKSLAALRSRVQGVDKAQSERGALDARPGGR